jgi:predicted AAA+ superfamily ATPase
MRSNLQHFRWIEKQLPVPPKRRLVVLTGARQTGKTTIARSVYSKLRYLNLDDVEARASLRELRTTSWARSIGDAVVDEAQKEPTVFDKVKYAFDAQEIDFTVLLGSSRILLLRQIRESLAGRAFLYDLWPLMLSELLTPSGEEPPRPLLDRLLRAESPLQAVLETQPETLLGLDAERRHAAAEHLALWGGMPALLPLDDEDRRVWLRSYRQTFLERDLVDLVRLSDLEPFRKLQELAMLRSGQLLSYSELARDAGVSAATARRYLEYLNLSYQIVLLRPYSRNLTSTVVKSPKLYWMDLGLSREITASRGTLSGAEFETLVVGECHKWIQTMSPDVKMYFYRTRSRMEVDVLLETPRGVLALEVKNRAQAFSADARALSELRKPLGSSWLGGLVVYRGTRLYPLREADDIWAMPIHRLF